MKKFKIFAFSILAIAFITIGLYSCSNEETHHSNQGDSEQMSNLQSKSVGDVLIANTDGTNVNPQIDLYEFESKLISASIFEEIESIVIDSKLDPITNGHESYLTIIGKKHGDFSLTAFQAELVKDGSNLYFPNPETPGLPITTFAEHTCAGKGCGSCAFVRKDNKKNGKITGCTCGDDDGGSCDHTVKDTDTSDKVKDVAKTVLEILK